MARGKGSKYIIQLLTGFEGNRLGKKIAVDDTYWYLTPSQRLSLMSNVGKGA